MTRLRRASDGAGRLRSLVLLSAAVLAAATAEAASSKALGQEAEIARRLSQTATSEVLRAIRNSNMSRAQARNRLRILGYDPFLADRYFDAIGQGRGLPDAMLDGGELEAFQGLGLIGDDATADDLLRPPLADSLENPDSAGPRVFGHRVFRQSTSRFDPLLAGPVGDDYVLGPGDAITLIITGNVEVVREQLVVSREGFLVIPDVGQVAVVGLTMEDLRERLFTHLRRVYSGISRSSDANTFFSVSIARLRTIQVRVLGEVVRPGSYQLSSVATVLEALYFAGGPTDQGTYRRVLLRRGRGALQEVDLYPYLTSGFLSEDHRLQSGDVLYVPEAGRQATVSGEVRRPAIFELAEGEGLKDLLGLAGGLLPSAATRRAAVERILPSADRSPGVDRVMVDAPLAAVLEGTETFDVQPGDVVHVSPVSDLLRRSVEVVGAVWYPGRYEFRPGMTLASLLERVGGAYADVLTDEVRVLRLDPETGNREIVAISSMQFELAEQDLVEVFSRNDLVPRDSVSVYGLVRRPGKYPHFEGMVAGDVVLSAGGFVVGADTRMAEVVRGRSVGLLEEPTLVRLREVISDLGLISGSNDDPPDTNGDDLDELLPEAAVPLAPGAEVYIRRRPNFEQLGHVIVAGAFQKPGFHPILAGDRLSDIVRRAGGPNSRADYSTLQLKRNGAVVGIGEGRDPQVVVGDSLRLRTLDQTVVVDGAVNFPSRIVYSSGLSMEMMLAQAGGVTDLADLDQVSVEHADGTRETAKKLLGLFRSYPDVRAGSKVFVPLKAADSDFDWFGALNTTLTATTAVTTLWFLVRDIRAN